MGYMIDYFILFFRTQNFSETRFSTNFSVNFYASTHTLYRSTSQNSDKSYSHSFLLCTFSLTRSESYISFFNHWTSTTDEYYKNSEI